MEAFLSSFFLIFAGEMGDKTQLLALVLAARFRRPGVILVAIFFATLANHALSVGAGSWLGSHVEADLLKKCVAATFFLFAIWVLIPDKETSVQKVGAFGAFVTTLLVFFLAEIGDKTQLATVVLGAHYAEAWAVLFGTTLGMLASNAIAIFLGERLLARLNMRWVRIFASGLFLVFGVGLLFSI